MRPNGRERNGDRGSPARRRSPSGLRADSPPPEMGGRPGDRSRTARGIAALAPPGAPLPIVVAGPSEPPESRRRAHRDARRDAGYRSDETCADAGEPGARTDGG